jgi:hypothetical protein
MTFGRRTDVGCEVARDMIRPHAAGQGIIGVCRTNGPRSDEYRAKRLLQVDALTVTRCARYKVVQTLRSEQ